MKEQLQRRLIPTYFNEFQCIGGACEDTCCAGWRIDIDQKTFKQYKKESNPAIKEKLKTSIKRNRSSLDLDTKYGLFKIDSTTQSCSMLSSDGLCEIQNILGADALCTTCSTYPREIFNVDNIIEKNLSLSCPEAAKLILNNTNGIDFIEEEGLELLQPAVYVKHNEKEYNLFWKLRIFMISTLQSRQHSLETRLLLLSMFIQKYIELENQTESTLQLLINKYEIYLNQPDLNEFFKKIPVNYKEQLSLILSLLNLRSTEKYAEFCSKIKYGLSLTENYSELESLTRYKNTLNTYYVEFNNKFSFILENYLVNAIYTQIKKPNKKSLLDSFTSICVDFTILRGLIIGMAQSQKQLNVEDSIICVQKYAKAIKHKTQYQKQISKLLQQDFASILYHITTLVHTEIK